MSKLHLTELKLPLILVAEIILCLAFGDLIPLTIKAAFYSMSAFLKEVLVLVLPFIIFSILFNSLGSLKKGAFSFAALAFALVILSNFVSTSLGGFLGSHLLDHLNITASVSTMANPLSPLWDTFLSPETVQKVTHFWPLAVLKAVSNDQALFMGIGCGFVLAMTGHKKARILSETLKNYGMGFFSKIFIPLMPLFILGYLLNMQHGGVLDTIFQNYFLVVVAIVAFAYMYIIFLYGVATHFNPTKWRASIRHIFPAMLTGFSTMSSASAMPLLINGVVKNTRHEASKSIVPISINIHLIGDCFAISILALAIMVSFGHALPTLFEFFIFTVFFVLAKFAVAAVPGGGILVMIPILEKYLGFTPDMLSLITALYILFDPLVTSANVFGNGAFAQLFEKFYDKVRRSDQQTLSQKSTP